MVSLVLVLGVGLLISSIFSLINKDDTGGFLIRLAMVEGLNLILWAFLWN